MQPCGLLQHSVPLTFLLIIGAHPTWPAIEMTSLVSNSFFFFFLRIFKAARENKNVPYKGTLISPSMDFSTKSRQARKRVE